jgi:hypothetical protein
MIKLFLLESLVTISVRVIYEGIIAERGSWPEVHRSDPLEKGSLLLPILMIIKDNPCTAKH